MRRPINTVNGYYKDPGKHWSAQDALNVLPRMAEKSGTRTVSKMEQCPGLRPFCRIGTNGGGEVGFTPSGAGRGMRVVDGRLFVVAGRTLWQITADGVSVPYGTIPGVGRVSMAHTQRGNGFELSIDNVQSRYVFNTLTKNLQKVTDTSFPGSMRAFAIDGYTGYLEPQGLYWGHSDLANALNYIAFDTYEAEGQPDRIVSATVDNNRQVLIIGQQTTEIYLNQGTAQAPFVRASNTIIPYGSAARDSVQNFGSGTVLLDQNRVVRILSTGDDRISTSVIDSALQECTRQQIANAYSFTLEGDGFQIYYLTVPGKFTFGFDFVNREWHRRSSTDLDWWAVTDVVQWNGKSYALDSRVGEIFEVRWRDYPFDGQKELVREWVTGSVSADQNPVYVHELELLFGCGGKSYEPVAFQNQPVGPQIEGSAPDGEIGEAYSYTYTVVPGDASIVRVSLLSGSLLPGLVWDSETATISGTPSRGGVMNLVIRAEDANELYAEVDDTFTVLGLVRWDAETLPGGGYDLDQDSTEFRAAVNFDMPIRADTTISSGDLYWECTTGYRISSVGNTHFGAAGLYRVSDGAIGRLIMRVGATLDGEAQSVGNVLFPPQLLYPNWVQPSSTTITATIRNRLKYTSGLATWLIAIDDGPWIEIMSGVSGEFIPYALSRGTSQDGGSASAKTVKISSRPDQFTRAIPDGAQPLAIAAPDGA